MTISNRKMLLYLIIQASICTAIEIVMQRYDGTIGIGIIAMLYFVVADFWEAKGNDILPYPKG